ETGPQSHRRPQGTRPRRPEWDSREDNGSAANRYERHSWAFFQLRQDITYKAAWAGVQVYLVNPRDTSRACPRCGYISKDNRKSQAEFACANSSDPCGYTGHADHVGAINVARKAQAQWAACQPAYGVASQGVDASPRL